MCQCTEEQEQSVTVNIQLHSTQEYPLNSVELLCIDFITSVLGFYNTHNTVTLRSQSLKFCRVLRTLSLCVTRMPDDGVTIKSRNMLHGIRYVT